MEKTGNRGLNGRLEALVFSLLLGLAMLSQYIYEPNYDSDILWSTAIGKWIDLHRTFPVVDSFSWTIIGKEWMTHEWVYSYLAFKLNYLFGSLGFYILTVIPMILTIYFLYLIARHYDENRTYAYILVFTVGIVLLYLLTLPFRAYIYALLFVALLVYLLYYKEEKNYDFLLYAGLFALWANFQVSVFIGLVILVAEMARKYLLQPTKRARVVAVSALSVLSTLINPYGYKLWTYFAFVLTGMEESKDISEWQAADFNEPWVLFLYLGVAGTMLALQFIFKASKPVHKDTELAADPQPVGTSRRNLAHLHRDFVAWAGETLTRETCLIIGFWCFYVYALYSVRMFIFALIFWIIGISYLVGRSTRFHFPYKTFYLYLLLFAVMFMANLATADFQLKDIFTYKKDITPVEEVAFLKENPQYSYHLFNEYIFGGYLIVKEIPVFIDARSDSYIKFGIQKKYMDVSGIKTDPQAVFDELGVQNLLIREGPLKKYMDINPQWKIVYWGPTAFVYSRVNTDT